MLEKEIEKNKQEQEAIKGSLVSAQIAFANEIKNGLGEQIKENIKNPPKPNKKIAFITIIKKIITKMFKIC